WDEVEELVRSGLIEVESHTLSHARVHTAPRLAGFLTPALQSGYASLDVPLIHEDERDLSAGAAALGTPLLVSAPRTGESLRFFEEPRIRRRAVETVAAGGGEAFFGQPDWEKRLRRLVAGPIEGRWETAA